MRTSRGVVLALIAPLLPLGFAPGHAVVRDRVTEHATAPALAAASARALPRLRVRTVARGLDHAWDAQRAPGGRILVTERDRARISVVRRGKRRTLADLSRLVWVSGETGLLSMAVDPRSRTLWACHGATTRHGNEVRVTRWAVNRSWTRLRTRRTVIGGLPTTSGRHGGCRLLLDRSSDSLYIGTGDAAVGTNPRDLDSLGGKVLRLVASTGKAHPGNNWYDASGPRRFVFTYGHRNVQGLAQKSGQSQVVSVEHGSDRDDEVNLLVGGGDYGWNPVPGYDESVPMTDHSLPGTQEDALWSSGAPTLATSGAAWVEGKQWRGLRGTLAVAALKASRLLFMRFKAGGVVSVRAPAALRRFGRLRSVTSMSDGDLLVTTDNGDGRDRVLRVSPR